MKAFALLMIASAIVFHALRKEYPMSDLTDAVTALVDEVADSTTKLESIKLFIEGVPALVGVAVTEALASANVEATEAAALIQTARQSVSDKVDEAVAAINLNTPPV